jgi:glycosyltransferase involved in cell wall biosynthesis
MKQGITFVIPCLNEELTLLRVLQKIARLRASTLDSVRPVEVIVADNGSTDRSVAIAHEHGARVVHCPQKGYGAALKSGILAATHPLVIFADADDTYDFAESSKLIDEVERGHDLVLGSRLHGKILKGAMPPLHRYLGTPVLTELINFLYGAPSRKISDCNSGFRCFYKEHFLRWEVKSDGMEFASEMLVRAMMMGTKISEVPVTLSPHDATRTPHLKTWRDGMRHLLQILLEAPRLFHLLGSVTFFLSWGLMLLSVFARKPVLWGHASIMGIHTTIFAFICSFLGLALWGIGLVLTAKRPACGVNIYQRLVNMPEDKLFWATLSFMLICFALIAVIVFYWARNHFTFLALEKETLILSALITNGVLLIFQIFTAHLIKRT